MVGFIGDTSVECHHCPVGSFFLHLVGLAGGPFDNITVKVPLVAFWCAAGQQVVVIHGNDRSGRDRINRYLERWRHGAVTAGIYTIDCNGS